MFYGLKNVFLKWVGLPRALKEWMALAWDCPLHTRRHVRCASVLHTLGG